MASAATARAMIAPREAWQWPKSFRHKKQPIDPDLKLPNECDFEYEVRQLKLSNAPLNRLIESPPLRYWAMLNARHKYVPTELLDAWGIVVNFETELF